jgi:hypothetical protein
MSELIYRLEVYGGIGTRFLATNGHEFSLILGGPHLHLPLGEGRGEGRCGGGF